MKKNLFFTFCFSFIPGAGQMYQNYMKRGLSLMIIFAMFLAISIVMEIPIFAIPLPIIFAYSFFDTYNIRNNLIEGNKLEDKYIWESKEFQRLKEINFTKKNKVSGIILILFGIYLIFNNVLLGIAYRYDITWLDILVTYISKYLPPIIISAISIAIGSKLLISKGKD